MGAVEALCSNAILLSHGKIESSSTNVRSVVTNYLKTGASDDSEWTNSGHDFLNDYFTPTRFTVVASDGTKLDMPLQANQDAFVQLEGFVEVLDPSLTIGYAVFTENEQVLFWSYQTDGAESKWPALRKGACFAVIFQSTF
jgi:lipopolysaccharide transport system ATP-binding protein